MFTKQCVCVIYANLSLFKECHRCKRDSASVFNSQDLPSLTIGRKPLIGLVPGPTEVSKTL